VFKLVVSRQHPTAEMSVLQRQVENGLQDNGAIPNAQPQNWGDIGGAVASGLSAAKVLSGGGTGELVLIGPSQIMACIACIHASERNAICRIVRIILLISRARQENVLENGDGFFCVAGSSEAL